ncbi:hypothetical protein LTS18_001439 [Coniosporium uncinatum]|uniref:Uncharacterized protein n=1 Tax=Coniosporium uncinatum TaxID=93489 RepID=A0ACC3DF81_9PEZI|nr:hypothetical protein LTS18_001439 [Coniosporium uncinatum]
MNLYLNNPTSAPKVYCRVSRLFGAHEDLLNDFHAFINPGGFLDIKNDGTGGGLLKKDDETLRRLKLRLTADDAFALGTSADPPPQQGTPRKRPVSVSSKHRHASSSGGSRNRSASASTLRKAIASSSDTALLASNARVSTRIRGPVRTTTRVQQVWDREVKGVMDYSMGPPPVGKRRTRNSMGTAAGGFGDLNDFDVGRLMESWGEDGRDDEGEDEEEGSGAGDDYDGDHVKKDEDGTKGKKKGADDDDDDLSATSMTKARTKIKPTWASAG